jgi:hypothetical protein
VGTVGGRIGVQIARQSLLLFDMMASMALSTLTRIAGRRNRVNHGTLTLIFTLKTDISVAVKINNAHDLCR